MDQDSSGLHKEMRSDLIRKAAQAWKWILVVIVVGIVFHYAYPSDRFDIIMADRWVFRIDKATGKTYYFSNQREPEWVAFKDPLHRQ